MLKDLIEQFRNWLREWLEIIPLEAQVNDLDTAVDDLQRDVDNLEDVKADEVWVRDELSRLEEDLDDNNS